MRPHRVFVSVIALGAFVGMSSTAAAGPSSDQEIAEQAVLTIDDVPEGFEEGDSGDDSNDLSVAACDAIQKAADAVNRAPNSEVSFDAGSGDLIAVINNQVTVLPSDKRAKALYRPYAAAKARRCLDEGFEESFAAQASGNPDVAADLEPFEPGGGDAAVGYEGTVEVTRGGETLEYFVELEIIRVGPALASFFFLNTGTPPPSDDVSAMVEAVVTRLEDSLA